MPPRRRPSIAAIPPPMSAASDLPRACSLSPNDPYWPIQPPVAMRPPPISTHLSSPNPRDDLRPASKPPFEKIPPAAGAAPMPAPPPDEDGTNGGVPPTVPPTPPVAPRTISATRTKPPKPPPPPAAEAVPVKAGTPNSNIPIPAAIRAICKAAFRLASVLRVMACLSVSAPGTTDSPRCTSAIPVCATVPPSS